MPTAFSDISRRGGLLLRSRLPFSYHSFTRGLARSSWKRPAQGKQQRARPSARHTREPAVATVPLATPTQEPSFLSRELVIAAAVSSGIVLVGMGYAYSELMKLGRDLKEARAELANNRAGSAPEGDSSQPVPDQGAAQTGPTGGDKVTPGTPKSADERARARADALRAAEAKTRQLARGRAPPRGALQAPATPGQGPLPAGGGGERRAPAGAGA